MYNVCWCSVFLSLYPSQKQVNTWWCFVIFVSENYPTVLHHYHDQLKLSFYVYRLLHFKLQKNPWKIDHIFIFFSLAGYYMYMMYNVWGVKPLEVRVILTISNSWDLWCGYFVPNYLLFQIHSIFMVPIKDMLRD